MLFSERSIWTMVHGIGLGGGALIGLGAALFYLYAARSSDGAAAPPGSGALAGAAVLSAEDSRRILASTYPESACLSPPVEKPWWRW